MKSLKELHLVGNRFVCKPRRVQKIQFFTQRRYQMLAYVLLIGLEQLFINQVQVNAIAQVFEYKGCENPFKRSVVDTFVLKSAKKQHSLIDSDELERKIEYTKLKYMHEIDELINQTLKF